MPRLVTLLLLALSLVHAGFLGIGGARSEAAPAPVSTNIVSRGRVVTLTAEPVMDVLLMDTMTLAMRDARRMARKMRKQLKRDGQPILDNADHIVGFSFSL